MTTGQAFARPPRWAEAILRLLLKPEDRESVSGDLLEQYRDTIVPTRGSAARRWYIQQVGWFLLRSSGAWGLVVGGALIVRYLFDTLVPPADFTVRATILTYTLMTAGLLAGFVMARRTRSIRGGALVAISAATIGAVSSIVGTAVMLAIWHDQATLEAWRASGGIGEAFLDVPLKVVALGAVLGVAGAVLGRLAASLPVRRFL